ARRRAPRAAPASPARAAGSATGSSACGSARAGRARAARAPPPRRAAAGRTACASCAPDRGFDVHGPGSYRSGSMAGPMATQVEELSENKVKLTVEVPAHDVQHAVSHAATDLAQ